MRYHSYFIHCDNMENIEKNQQVVTDESSVPGECIPEDFDVEDHLLAIELKYSSLFELLYEVWDCFKPLSHNLRLLIAFLSKCIFEGKSKKSSSDIYLIHHMKNMLAEVYKSATTIEVENPNCNKVELYDYIRYNVSHESYALFMNRFITEENFKGLINAYKRHLSNLAECATSIPTTSFVRDPPAAEMLDTRRGLNGLFETISERNDVMQQFITKPQKGKKVTIKTPGEIGPQLIRLYLYDVNDIRGKEKKNWWRYSKLRAQFLTGKSDRKSQLVQQLLDETANDLAKVSGVCKEIRELD